MQTLPIHSISTHALTEGDTSTEIRSTLRKDFNSRPHGGRQPGQPSELAAATFQLTPSRRATMTLLASSVQALFQLTPSRRATDGSNPRERSGGISTHALTEGDRVSDRRAHIHNISTHALTEGDQIRRQKSHGNHISTHALTEGDWVRPFVNIKHLISTHALTEGDGGFNRKQIVGYDFNSRPHGGRRRDRRSGRSGGQFQLTPSRRAT